MIGLLRSNLEIFLLQNLVLNGFFIDLSGVVIWQDISPSGNILLEMDTKLIYY